MKFLTLILFSITSIAYGQLTMEKAREIIQPYHLGYSTYFDPFVEKPGYGAPWILTADGGAAGFGDNVLYKFNKDGKEVWKHTVKPQFGEMENQAVAEDKKGNLFAFTLSYDPKRYRGGSQRVVCYDKTGKLLWDKTIGAYTQVNNPIVDWVKPIDDGRIYMRGHVVKEKPAEGKDPVTKYWEGWFDSTGKLTQKAGDPIDWSSEEWQKKFKPE
jgi:hypothetical protein